MNETNDPYNLGLSYKDTVADFSVLTSKEVEVVVTNSECGGMVILNKSQVEKLRNFLNTFLDEQR